MSEKNDLLAIGHTAFDYIISLEKFPIANSSAAINTMKNLYGGAAANVAMVGSNLGLQTSLISAVGKKFIDSSYHNQMKDLEINTSYLIISETEDTPTAFVLTDENMNQISYFYWGAGKEFEKTEVPIEAIKKTKAVHLATGDPNFNCRSGIIANDQEKIVTFDPGQDLHMYSPEKLKDTLSNTTILFGNHHEIKRILETLSIDINGLKALGPDIVVKTCGKDGSIIYNKHEKIKVDSIYRPAIDPTGAGDSYRAGFIYKYLNDSSLEDCAKFASSVSSFIVEAEGCQTNIPNYEKTIERMNRYY
ncbi:MAG: carbohydrate kinase family protein [Methanobrevibacter sp.]|nr:carbohydrate kinase family protein [Methanobrevibacter sp.]